ncbi:hypothetical protein OG194_32500 [Streptomyces sp. NBC_01288]|uniref:hypothetical protein n=1 Tax=Streptomyces sp. NBC_01288 TaxID=2903814 RepID=UPI002E11AAD1|nr:hypothetical protein OG194_32500 [Streptomyces sp. NBC_01288]
MISQGVAKYRRARYDYPHTEALAIPERCRGDVLKTLTLTFLLLILTAVVPLGTLDQHWEATAMRSVAAGVIFVALCRAGQRYHVKKIKKTIVTRESYTSVPESRAKSLQRMAGTGRLLDPFQAKIFTLAVTQPIELRQRVDEVYVPQKRTLQRSVTVEFQIPSELLPTPGEDSAEEQRVFIPFVFARKGKYLDNLKVSDGTGKNLGVLSYRESLLLSAGVLRVLILGALQATDGKLSQKVAETERLALAAIIERNNPDIRRAANSNESEAAVRGREELLKMQGIRNPASRDLAVLLVEKLAKNYALIASVPLPHDGRFVIRYEETTIPKLDLVPEKITSRFGERGVDLKRRFKALLRVLLGTRPVSLKVPLDNASTCQSFHVRVQSPEGLYLAHQEFLLGEEKEEYLTKLQYNAPTSPHYRFRRRLGQPYAHFYGRFFPEPKNPDKAPTLTFHFFETPPGSSFRAAIAAATCFWLVWAIGLVISIKGDPGTDAPAFLLVFPGVAASWLGFDSKPNSLFEGTLTARVSLFVTTVVSMTASGLYMINVSKVTFPVHLDTWRFGFLGVSRLPWMVLVAISLINAAWIIYKWLMHTATFKFLAEREQ